MTVIGNAFSVNMLEGSRVIAFTRVSLIEVIAHVQMEKEIKSIVGHETTARIFSRIFGREIKFNREEYKMKIGDILIVGVIKKRLQEGKVLELAEINIGEIEWWRIKEVNG